MTPAEVRDIRTLPAPTIKRLLREAGSNLSDIARRRKIHPSIVSRVVRKQVTSAPVWEEIARVLGALPAMRAGKGK